MSTNNDAGTYAIVNTTSTGFSTSGLLVAQQPSLRLYSGNNAVSLITVESNSPLAFSTNATERMRILAGGNVAVGNSAPTQKFEVSGNITIVAGVLYLVDATTPFHYWSSTFNSGVLTWTDTGSATKP